MSEIFGIGDLKKRRSGILYGISAYIAWGFLPLYWKLLKQVPADQIISHRIVWSFIFVTVMMIYYKNLGSLKEAIKDKKKLLLVSFCSVLITINWFTYIWAVNSGHIVDASMGYYINPLMSVLLGIFVLKERLNAMQYGAIALAAAGVLVIALEYGKFPWIALTLAVSFALYGLFKKMLHVESMTGLGLETAILTPFALFYMLYCQGKGIGAFGSLSLPLTLLLLCAGIVTATPLLWFAKAARSVELTTIGFLQYISPTISLGLGVFVYGEPFTGERLVSFGLIWVALMLYTLSHAGLFNITLNLKKVNH